MIAYQKEPDTLSKIKKELIDISVNQEPSKLIIKQRQIDDG